MEDILMDLSVIRRVLAQLWSALLVYLTDVLPEGILDWIGVPYAE